MICVAGTVKRFKKCSSSAIVFAHIGFCKQTVGVRDLHVECFKLKNLGRPLDDLPLPLVPATCLIPKGVRFCFSGWVMGTGTLLSRISYKSQKHYSPCSPKDGHHRGFFLLSLEEMVSRETKKSLLRPALLCPPSPTIIALSLTTFQHSCLTSSHLNIEGFPGPLGLQFWWLLRHGKCGWSRSVHTSLSLAYSLFWWREMGEPSHPTLSTEAHRVGLLRQGL